jgi:hypothetical protein
VELILQLVAGFLYQLQHLQQVMLVIFGLKSNANESMEWIIVGSCQISSSLERI